MIIKNLHQYRSEYTAIQHGSFSFLKISNTDTLSSLSDKPDALIVSDPGVLIAVRNDPMWYLTPVFTEGFDHHLSDGIYHPEQTSHLSQKVQQLQSEISQYQQIELPTAHDEYLLIKSLRYIATRQTSISPRLDRQSKIGYRHEHITIGSAASDALGVVQQLKKWQKMGYLKSKPVDKVNLCYDCSGSYLNFVETCPKCHSIDLKNEELVHHFRCAYIGPQSDYESEGQLICPKCAKELKHIGIDYDKPSEIHNCQQCSYTGQETDMKARCVDCAKENTLDQIQTMSIDAYAISEKGLHFCSTSTLSSQQNETHIDAASRLLPFKVFEMIRAHEIKKKHRDHRNNYDLSLIIDQQVLQTLHDNLKRQLVEEIAQIIQTYIKEYDIQTISQENNIQLFLLGYDHEVAQELKSTIVYNINKMMNDNSLTQNAFITAQIQAI